MSNVPLLIPFQIPSILDLQDQATILITTCSDTAAMLVIVTIPSFFLFRVAYIPTTMGRSAKTHKRVVCFHRFRIIIINLT